MNPNFRRRTVSAFLLGFLLSAAPSLAADPPQAEISNGQVTSKMYLPDAKDGYYRSTRFDWAGAVYSVQYKGHEFCAKWFDEVDPTVINWVHRDGKIVNGPCGALWGPVEEFQIPLGWNEAKVGGPFVKIGVGVLKKGEGRYNSYAPYEILDSGKWSVKTQPDAIEFTHVLAEPTTGFAYEYHKVVRLAKDRPELIFEHRLKNTGQKAIQSNMYNHNFMQIDKQSPGPNYTVKVPYQIQNNRPPDKALAEVRGNEVVFNKTLVDKDELTVFLQGFSENPKDYEITIENKNAGAGMKIVVDHALTRSFIWSMRTTLVVEPYIAINVEPGKELSWKNSVTYFTLPVGN